MIRLKVKEDIDKLRRGGKILASVISQVAAATQPGVTTKDLTELAEKLIKAAGGRPSFKGYKAAWSENMFPSALCVSVNDEVVHGLPVPPRTIKAGDVVGLDCGLEYEGMFTDMARTVIAGPALNKEIKKLLTVTEEALMRGIKQVKPGNKISDISRAIVQHAEQHGFSVVRQLVGHGVGYQPHEDPQVPNFVDRTVPDVKLAEGLVIAIEPMVNLGGWEVESKDDGWTIVTKDGSISAHFEHTVAVTKKGYEILTM